MARRRTLGRVVVDTSVVIRAARAFRQQPPEPNMPELKLVLAWRNDPAIFTWIYSQEVLGQDAGAVRAYGLEILRQLKEALGIFWNSGANPELLFGELVDMVVQQAS